MKLQTGADPRGRRGPALSVTTRDLLAPVLGSEDDFGCSPAYEADDEHLILVQQRSVASRERSGAAAVERLGSVVRLDSAADVGVPGDANNVAGSHDERAGALARASAQDGD